MVLFTLLGAATLLLEKQINTSQIAKTVKAKEPQILAKPTTQPTPTTIKIPINQLNQPAPEVTAKSVIVIDPKSNTVVLEKNPDQQLLPASTTKIMTALVALDTYNLDQTITISEEERTIGHTMELVRGEQITVRNLLYGLLVASGNDAALALALAYPSNGYSGFVAAMNQKAQALNLTNTKFQNVSGLESPQHYSSARDLATLTMHAKQNFLFNQITATKQTQLTNSNATITHSLTNTNQLLGNLEGVDGVKTGWTENAGECLVTSSQRKEEQFIVVVLGSRDRFGETKNLLNWAHENFQWQ